MVVAVGGYDPIMRSIIASFVVAPPAGARVRTRIRPSKQDTAVLHLVGAYLGGLASGDLACRCAMGPGADGRTGRKRALTVASSSRWAGAITRTSNDQWQRGYRNLLVARTNLRRAIRVIDRRLAVPVGQRRGRARGYAARQERYAKQQRLQHLQACLARVEYRLAEGRVSVCRGGRRLAKVRHHLTDARLTEGQWRQQWQAERWFLTADGEAAKPLGNETIRVHPEQGWVELKLPAPLAYLANRPHGRYRLSCPVQFNHRADEWAAQVASGTVRYDIAYRPDRARWYLSASWTRPAPPAVTVPRAVAGGVLAVDLNAGHLACWQIDPDGNPVGIGVDIPLPWDGLPASTRDGLAQMATNRGIAVVAMDPAWTSKWGAAYWQRPLQARYPRREITRHHAACVVLGRRALGLKARRRPGVPAPHRRMEAAGMHPAGVESYRPGRAGVRVRAGHDPPATRPGSSLELQKTDSGDRTQFGVQVAQDRSVSPVSADTG